MAEFTFAKKKIMYISQSIKITKTKNYSTNTFVGSKNSNDVTYISTEGKTISFHSIVPRNNISTLDTYRNLAKKYTNKSAVLVGSRDLAVEGNYYLVKCDEEKLVNGSFRFEWEFVEYMKPNIVEKTFKRIGKKKKKASSKKSGTKTSKKKPSTYITVLLTDCGTMKKGKTGSKCVKYLQKFLQKKGYYKNCKIDGDYLSETKKAVNQLQKAYKIKVTKSNQGVWDKKTRDYWRKKYNITSKKKDKTATAILSSNIGKMMK